MSSISRTNKAVGSLILNFYYHISKDLTTVLPCINGIWKPNKQFITNCCEATHTLSVRVQGVNNELVESCLQRQEP